MGWSQPKIGCWVLAGAHLVTPSVTAQKPEKTQIEDESENEDEEEEEEEKESE